MVKRKRLFLDIEVSPNEGFFWSPGHKINIPYDNITRERAIICICYQWEGGKMSSLSWDKNKCDKKMVAEFIGVMNQADELIGHNLDRFDIPWIRTRAFKHRIPMNPKYPTLDTLKEARRLLRLNSNRLDYISKFSGSEGKIHTDFSMWRAITLNNDQVALAKMIKYCKGDIRELRKVFEQLNPYLPAKTHYGVANGKGKLSCPECGSGRMNKQRNRVSAAGVKSTVYQCQGCGKYHQVNDKVRNK